MANIDIMTGVTLQQQNKIHPHKFALWIGIGSILMMFAGLTSAYIVKRNQAGWTGFEIPNYFWISTATILGSSLTIFLATKAFKNRLMKKYRSLMAATLFLGLLFIIFQVLGFVNIWEQGHTLQSTVSYSFLYVIVGFHAAHVLGGLVILVVMALKAFNLTTRNYSNVPVELTATYWHFVDVLWLYLLVFLIMIK